MSSPGSESGERCDEDVKEKKLECAPSLTSPLWLNKRVNFTCSTIQKSLSVVSFYYRKPQGQ